MKLITHCPVIAILVAITILASAVVTCHTITTQKDNHRILCWALEEGGIDAKGMWDDLENLKRMKHLVVVAVIDSGIDYSSFAPHGRIWNNKQEIPYNNIDDDNNGYVDDLIGWDFVNDKGASFGCPDNHGTACTSIILADREQLGIKGVASEVPVQVMTLKVLPEESPQNQLSLDIVAEAVSYAEENGASICNISLAAYHDNKKLYDVMKRSDMLFVVGAGNDYYRDIDKDKIFPASYLLRNVITVCNTNSTGTLDQTSNYGSQSVDVAAPGTDINVLASGGRRSIVTGTSFSTAYVTGIATVLKSVNFDLNAEQMKSIIKQSVRQTQTLLGKCVTGGIVDAKKALEYELLQEEY